MQVQVEIMKAAGDMEYLSIATFLPLRRFRNIPAFIMMSQRVQQQLRATQGLVRYGLKTDFLRKYFWTCSVWTNKTAADAFVRAEPHATALKRFKDWAAPGAAFVEWHAANPSINWAEVLEQLSHPTFRYS
jgi:hypothetical protein